MIVVAAGLLASYGWRRWHEIIEESKLTRREIRECVALPHIYFHDLLECLVGKSSERIKSITVYRAIRDANKKSERFFDHPRKMARYVDNPAVPGNALIPKDVVAVYWIGDDENRSAAAGGPYEEWWFFVDANDRLLGWLPGVNPP